MAASGKKARGAIGARRYAPLLVAVAAQLVVIALWPSKPVSTSSVQTTGPRGTRSATGVASGDTSVVVPELATGAGGETSTAGGGATPVGGATGGGEANVAGSGDVHDIAHCVGDRQFDPALDFYAPPCVPKWRGDNGGATYRGVSSDTVKVVEYHPHQSDAINTVLKSIGKYESPEQREAFRSAAEKMINDRFELYGRKLDIVEVEGTCTTTPPDVACLRNEFRGIVIDQQPFAFITGSPCSACVDELAQQGVVIAGSQYFPDGFLQSMAPYYWNSLQGGTRIAQHFAQFWCANLAGKPASYAVNRVGNTNGQMRRLGVISSNDPQSQIVIDDLKAELAACGDSVAAEYYYSPDPTTAAQQAQAGLDIMRSRGVTSLAFFADSAGPGFFYALEQSDNYFPEALVSGAGRQDTDSVGQGYSKEGGTACPAGRPCSFDTAFGVGPVREPPSDKGPAINIWRAAGNEGPVPSDADDTNWEHYRLLATLLQASGPDLTPANIEQGVRSYPARGDDQHTLLGFDGGGYSWSQDSRIVYWDRNATSTVNGKQGAFIQIGPRVALGGFVRDGLGTLPPR
jgi:hypothetical protein